MDVFTACLEHACQTCHQQNEVEKLNPSPLDDTIPPIINLDAVMPELTSIIAQIKDCQGRVDALRRYL